MSPPARFPKYRCRSCGVTLPAWIPVAQEPDGTMLLNHLSQRHPDCVGHHLDQMHHDEDITPVVLEAYEAVEGTEGP